MAKFKLVHTIMILVNFLLFPSVSYAKNQVYDNILLNCKQSKDNTILRCEYRQVIPEPLFSISAISGDITLAVTEDFTYPNKDGITAILFLVDTSDPARENVIQKNKQHIQELLKASSKQQRFGLASFDSNFRLEAPIGSSHEQIISSVQKLNAVGKTTELYRSMLQAIKLLERIGADRKSIFLFSDGLAEDKAYFREDVVNAAQNAGVVITSLGYPRSVSQSVSLQTLRRISEETGGMFIETDFNFNMPQGYTDQLFGSIDNGGQITIELGKLFANATSADNKLVLNFETDTRHSSITIPVTVPYEPKQNVIEKVIQVPQTPTQQAMQQPVKVVTVQQQRESIFSSWLWYGIPLALLVLIALTIAIFYISLKRNWSKPAEEKSEFDGFKPYAYLVVQDETQKRYPITRETWRIGRSKDNELTLRDNSISRRHAEIHRDKGDIFTLIDLGSLNGVFVNNVKVKKHRLHEGDILEIGDVGLRFTLYSNEYQMEEATVMQNTRAPITH